MAVGQRRPRKAPDWNALFEVAQAQAGHFTTRQAAAAGYSPQLLAYLGGKKDVDLRMMGSPKSVLGTLQEAGRLDLGDAMTFEIQPDDEHPEIQNEGMRYEG